MDLLDPTTQCATGGTILVLIVAFLLFQPTNLVKWLQKKNYQYEVTFALYMLTPTEKFIFNSIVFLTFSMFSTACIVYLPNHIATVSRRAYYYCVGDADILDTAASQLERTASKASEAVMGAATGFAGAAYQAAVNTASVAQEAVNHAAENLGWN